MQKEVGIERLGPDGSYFRYLSITKFQDRFIWTLIDTNSTANGEYLSVRELDNLTTSMKNAVCTSYNRLPGSGIGFRYSYHNTSGRMIHDVRFTC